MNILQQIREEKNDVLPLADRLYFDLLRDILLGDLPRGSRLIESKLCDKYGASRTPMRETFRRLETDGLVEYIPNRGTFVRGLTPLEVADLMAVWSDMEVHAVRWCVERMTDEEIEELQEIWGYAEYYTGKYDIPKLIDINNAFHRCIYQGTHDHFLADTLIKYQNYAAIAAPPNYFAKNVMDRILAEHRRIYQAIVNRDAAAASRTMRLHMTNTIKRSSLVISIFED